MRARSCLLGTVLLCATTGALGGCDDATAANAKPAAATPVSTHAAYRDTMRQLFAEQAAWTRFYLMSAVAELPDAPAAMDRLDQNAIDVGGAFRPVYGTATATQITALLRAQLVDFSTVVETAKAGDPYGFNAARVDWYADADRTAAYIASVTPGASLDDIDTAYRAYLDATLGAVAGRTNAAWDDDMTAFDNAETTAFTLSDLLVDDAANGYPDLVPRTAEPAAAAEDMHLALRRLWQDHATYTRSFVVSALSGLADADAAMKRLLQNQTDLGIAFTKLTGPTTARKLSSIFRNEALDLEALVEATRISDKTKYTQAHDAWDLNATVLAGALADATSESTFDDLQKLIREDHTTLEAEVTARTSENWQVDVDQADRAGLYVTDTADTLTFGIANANTNARRPM